MENSTRFNLLGKNLPGSHAHAKEKANTITPGVLPEAIKCLKGQSVIYITALIKMEVTR